MNQPLLPVVQPEHQRSEIFAATLRIGIAPDNAFLTLRNFNFLPIVRSLLLINAIPFLRNNAFQSALLRRFEKVEPFFWIMIREIKDSILTLASQDTFLQHSLALLQRNPPQIDSIDIQKIERIVNNPHPFAPRPALLSRLEPGPLLHQTKRRTPLIIQRHNLPI